MLIPFHPGTVGAGGLVAALHAAHQQTGLAGIKRGKLFQRFDGEALSIAVDLVVTEGSGEGVIPPAR